MFDKPTKLLPSLSRFNDSANDSDRQLFNFFIGIEMRRVNDWIEAYQGDALRAFFTCLQVAKFLNIAFPELKSC